MITVALVRALIDTRAVISGLPGPVSLQRGERPALVWRDPHVDHRVVAAGVDGRRGAVAVGVGQPDDDRFAGVVQTPAQVLVDVPLHEAAAEIDELRIIDRTVVGDEHR